MVRRRSIRQGKGRENRRESKPGAPEQGPFSKGINLSTAPRSDQNDRNDEAVISNSQHKRTSVENTKKQPYLNDVSVTAFNRNV